MLSDSAPVELVAMEDDNERPTKIRKLSQGSPIGEPAPQRRNSSSESNSQHITVSNGTDDEDNAEADVPAGGEDGAQNAASKPMSKNQLKKLRKREEWEAGRDYRKAKRKQKTKEKRQRKKAANEERKAAAGEAAAEAVPLSRKPRNPVHLPVTFIIDCGFDDLMVEKEYISLGSQLTRAYSDNAKSALQAHLAISSWSGRLKERFDTTLHGHYRQWRGMHFRTEDFVEVARQANDWMADPKKNKMLGAFAKHASSAEFSPPQPPPPPAREQPDEPAVTESTVPESASNADPTPAPGQQPTTQLSNNSPSHPNGNNANGTHQTSSSDSTTTTTEGEVIYLTADSPHTLTTLSPYSTYIIGGLVDKNRYKGICYKIARERGIKTAKLPIGEFMEMQSRSVLATNHVVEIMLRWLELGDWGEAFVRVIPKRKGGRLRGEADGDGDRDGDGDGEEKDGEDGDVADGDEEGRENEDEDAPGNVQAGDGNP